MLATIRTSFHWLPHWLCLWASSKIREVEWLCQILLVEFLLVNPVRQESPIVRVSKDPTISKQTDKFLNRWATHSSKLLNKKWLTPHIWCRWWVHNNCRCQFHKLLIWWLACHSPWICRCSQSWQRVKSIATRSWICLWAISLWSRTSSRKSSWLVLWSSAMWLSWLLRSFHPRLQAWSLICLLLTWTTVCLDWRLCKWRYVLQCNCCWRRAIWRRCKFVICRFARWMCRTWWCLSRKPSQFSLTD